MPKKKPTKKKWWIIFIVVAILFICDLFIVDPIPFIDEVILFIATITTLAGAIENTIKK